MVLACSSYRVPSRTPAGLLYYIPLRDCVHKVRTLGHCEDKDLKNGASQTKSYNTSESVPQLRVDAYVHNGTLIGHKNGREQCLLEFL